MCWELQCALQVLYGLCWCVLVSGISTCVLPAAGASAQLRFSPVKALGAVLALGVSSSLLTQIFVLRSVGYHPKAFPHPSLVPVLALPGVQNRIQAARIALGSPEMEQLRGAEPARSLEQCSCSLGCLGVKKDFVGEVGCALLALGLQTLL